MGAAALLAPVGAPLVGAALSGKGAALSTRVAAGHACWFESLGTLWGHLAMTLATPVLVSRIAECGYKTGRRSRAGKAAGPLPSLGR